MQYEQIEKESCNMAKAFWILMEMLNVRFLDIKKAFTSGKKALKVSKNSR